jgi:hypothetical protein
MLSFNNKSGSPAFIYTEFEIKWRKIQMDVKFPGAYGVWWWHPLQVVE